MHTELCRPADNDLRVAVSCLEMEVSDSVLKDLLAAIADRRQDETNDFSAKLLLQNMDTVTHHIDTLRVKSSLRAFSLINELWDAYLVATNSQDEEESRESALAMTQQILDWQQQCHVELSKRQPAKTPARTSPPSPAVTELLQEQIAETDSLIRVEMAALKELAQASPGPALKEQVSAAITDQANSLQDFFSQEMNKLRQELRPDSEQI